MNKKQIKQLAAESYKGINLDPVKAEKISNLLKREDLKQYIKFLKDFERKNSVIVTLPKEPNTQDQKVFKNLFPDKKILYNVDKSLVLGARIIDNDIVYETSVKNTLDNLLNHISTYDK